MKPPELRTVSVPSAHSLGVGVYSEGRCQVQILAWPLSGLCGQARAVLFVLQFPHLDNRDDVMSV